MFTDHIHDQIGKYRAGVINESMPDFIKEAEEKIVTEDLTKLADGAFAYSDGINRFFPIHSPEHTWMSQAYFEKFANEIDEQTREEVRSRIENACTAFNLPENTLVKTAGSQEDEIDSLHSLAIELNKFLANYKRISPENRHKVAREIIGRAHSLGKKDGGHEIVNRYGGEHLDKNYAHAFYNRMRYFKHDSPERNTLLKMQDEAETASPELLAKALSIFDERAGLHKHYDIGLADPYYSLLSSECPKCEDCEIDGYKLHNDKIKSFDYESLKDMLEEGIFNSLRSNPIDGIRNIKTPSLRIMIIKKINND